MEEVKFVKKLGVNLMVGYTKLKRVLIVSARDVYLHVFMHIDSSGRIFMIGFDEDTESYPDEDGCVRMSMPIAGYVFTPTSEQTCDITMIVECDPRGTIPEKVKEMVMRESA